MYGGHTSISLPWQLRIWYFTSGTPVFTADGVWKSVICIQGNRGHNVDFDETVVYCSQRL